MHTQTEQKTMQRSDEGKKQHDSMQKKPENSIQGQCRV